MLIRLVRAQIEKKTYGFSRLSQSKLVIEDRVRFRKTKNQKNLALFDEKSLEFNCTLCQQDPPFH